MNVMNFLVDYLSPNAQPEDFYCLFAQYGQVSSVMILDIPSTHNKLSVIIKMPESPIGGRIISARLNGSRWRGSLLYVYIPLFLQDNVTT
jgi:hypothetical protein